jgi:hypothetical protein
MMMMVMMMVMVIMHDHLRRAEREVARLHADRTLSPVRRAAALATLQRKIATLAARIAEDRKR